MQSRFAVYFRFFPSFLLLSWLGFNAHAQNDICTHLNNDSYNYSGLIAYKAFLEKTEENNASRLEKKIQKQYDKIIAEKNTDIIKQLREKEFLFDDTVYPYLQNIFNHILETNSLDKNQFHFFVDRTSAVNAYSYEDGTIVCNLGLLSIMENESQITMVLCHEFGHYLLNHVNTAIIKQLTRYNSPEFLSLVNKIKRQKYNTKTQLEDLLTVDVFDRSKHSRTQERAADSLGMLLFRNTGYNCKTVSRVFDLLDSSDNKIAVCPIQHFLKQQGISADDDWFTPVKKMSFGAAIKKETADSLKTHPDCAQRKITMQQHFDKNPKAGTDFLISNAQNLAAIKKIAFFNEATYSKDKDNLGFYFYQLIQNNALFPSDNCIKTEIFETLSSICKHQKAHTLYMVVGSQYIPENENDEYAKLLKLLDSISLKKMIEITNTYYQNNKSLITASTEAINNLNTLIN